jgi:signal transduction histidine kinase
MQGTNISSIFRLQEQMIENFAQVYFTSLFLSLILILILTTLLLRPIRRMSKMATQITTGSYSVRIPNKGKDELGDLSRSFNFMADSIEDKILELSNAALQKEEFVANFAHELKTPLTSVIGYADMLVTRDLSKEDTKLAANYILKEGLRLESLSFKLLDLIVLGKSNFNLETTSIETFLEQIVESITPLLEEKKVHIDLSLTPMNVSTEQDLFKTLVLNLLDNGIKAGANQISIIGEEVAPSYKENGTQLVRKYQISIKDNGVGIPKEELPRITEAFYMINKSRTTTESNVGLGLALASKIATIHHTKLKFQSKLGKGTKVLFTVPICQEKLKEKEDV